MSPLDRDLLLLSVVGMSFVLPAVVIMRRGLTDAGVLGLLGRLAAGFLGFMGLGVAAAVALDPLVEHDIAACRAAGGYDCEDAGLFLVIVLLAGVLAAFAWLVLALIVRIIGRATGGGAQRSETPPEDLF